MQQVISNLRIYYPLKTSVHIIQLYFHRKNPSTHWIRDWEGPRASFNIVAEKKILLCQESNPCYPIQSLAILLTDVLPYNFTNK